jgi:hypothetical protein
MCTLWLFHDHKVRIGKKTSLIWGMVAFFLKKHNTMKAIVRRPCGTSWTSPIQMTTCGARDNVRHVLNRVKADRGVPGVDFSLSEGLNPRAGCRSAPLWSQIRRCKPPGPGSVVTVSFCRCAAQERLLHIFLDKEMITAIVWLNVQPKKSLLVGGGHVSATRTKPETGVIHRDP